MWGSAGTSCGQHRATLATQQVFLHCGSGSYIWCQQLHLKPIFSAFLQNLKLLPAGMKWYWKCSADCFPFPAFHFSPGFHRSSPLAACATDRDKFSVAMPPLSLRCKLLCYSQVADRPGCPQPCGEVGTGHPAWQWQLPKALRVTSRQKDSRAALTRTGSSELNTALAEGLTPHSLFLSAGRDLKSW